MKRNPPNPHGKSPLPLRSEAPSLYAYAESNPSPILVTNTDGEIQYVNGAWQNLTGYSREEVVGKNPHFLNAGKTPPELYRQLWNALRKGESFESEGFIDKKKDGTEFSIRAVFFPVKINDAVAYFVQVLQDITERKKIEKRRETFIATASHEMRNPLSAIMFSLELLKHKLGTMPNEAKDTFKTLEDEAGRFRKLLNYLLDVNKIQTGILQIQKKENELRGLVENTITELQPAYPTHALFFEKGTPIKVMCDEARVTQVLTNLISNAVKYSPEANRVLLCAKEEDRMAVVSIQDFGLGIAEAEQKRVFDVLYRAKNKGNIEGTGLGLYISAQIIAAHGGHLWVTSELGKGSIFNFSLPLANF